MKTFRKTFIIIFVLIAAVSCTPKISSQSRPWYCVELPTEPSHSGTLTPTPNRFTHAPNPTRPALPTRRYEHVYDLSPNLPIEEKAEIIVFRCNGTYDLYRLGPEINPDQDIGLKKGDIILSSSPPSVLMGHQPPPTATTTPTKAFTPTRTVTTCSLVPIPTEKTCPTPIPYTDDYPIKQVWIQYGFTPYWDLSGTLQIPRLILYSDGTLIVFKDQKFLTKTMTKDEICSLFAWIDRKGFSQIKTDGIDYKTDPIYGDLPREHIDTQSYYEYLMINGNHPKSMYIYHPLENEATQPAKDTLRFIRNYLPDDLQTYHPDRIRVHIELGRIYVEMKHYQAIPWPTDATPLIKRNSFGSLYLEGDMANRIYQLFNSPFATRVISSNGFEYSVNAVPLLPHERLMSDYYIEVDQTKQFEPPLMCDAGLKSFEIP